MYFKARYRTTLVLEDVSRGAFSWLGFCVADMYGGANTHFCTSTFVYFESTPGILAISTLLCRNLRDSVCQGMPEVFLPRMCNIYDHG